MFASETKKKIVCTLCGLPVLINGFTLQNSHGEQKFCCAGCLSIYQLFHGEESTSPNSTESPKENT